MFGNSDFSDAKFQSTPKTNKQSFSGSPSYDIQGKRRAFATSTSLEYTEANIEIAKPGFDIKRHGVNVTPKSSTRMRPENTDTMKNMANLP